MNKFWGNEAQGKEQGMKSSLQSQILLNACVCGEIVRQVSCLIEQAHTPQSMFSWGWCGVEEESSHLHRPLLLARRSNTTHQAAWNILVQKHLWGEKGVIFGKIIGEYVDKNTLVS